MSSDDVSCVMFHVSCVMFHVSCVVQASKSGWSSMSSATAKIMPRSLSLSLALARALSLSGEELVLCPVVVRERSQQTCDTHARRQARSQQATGARSKDPSNHHDLAVFAGGIRA